MHIYVWFIYICIFTHIVVRSFCLIIQWRDYQHITDIDIQLSFYLHTVIWCLISLNSMTKGNDAVVCRTLSLILFYIYVLINITLNSL